MRDITTINAICWMIKHRQQVAEIPNTCDSEAELGAAIRHACEEAGVAFCQKTEALLPEKDRTRFIPDWEALNEIAKVLCVSENHPG